MIPDRSEVKLSLRMEHQLRTYPPGVVQKGTAAASPWWALRTASRNILVTVGLFILLQDMYLLALTSRLREDDCETWDAFPKQLDFHESTDLRRNVKSFPSNRAPQPDPQVEVSPRVDPKPRTRRRNVLPNRQAYLGLLGQVNDSAVLTKLPDVPFNYGRIKKLRNDVFKETHVKKYLFASQENTPLGSPLLFFENRNTSQYYAVPQLHKILPSTDNRKLRWPKNPLRSCSVVGNGGILLDSGCGPSIDSSSIVLRSNLPPLTLESALGGAAAGLKHVDYYKDVGKKTSFVTFNPSGYFEYLGKLENDKLLQTFKEYMDQFGNAIAWTHMFHYQSKAKPALEIIRLSQALRFKTTIVSSHAKFLQGVNDFWKRRGLTGFRATSGLVLTAVSLALCKETNLYGYWPFPVDYEGREVNYHYYQYDAEHKQNNTVHKLPEEFKILQKLHRSGVLKLHIGECGKND
ncbi:Glycosyltransferase 29 (sialyltransferase) [Branchiostoma belcheri]|nr:Glycosyltransferase 29 (sialyltransferase) [Branchiostoma belcheri]